MTPTESTNPLPQEAELREAIDKALHIDWAFKKGKPTRIIIDGSMTKGAYHTDYETFVGNIMQLLTDYARKERIDELTQIQAVGYKYLDRGCASEWFDEQDYIKHRLAALKPHLAALKPHHKAEE